MNPITYRFHDPDRVIDHVHELFEQWEADSTLAPYVDADTLYRLKLAVHEWLANLVQHADFQDREPLISVTVAPNCSGIHCAIEDNSEGFDLDGHFSVKREVLDAFPERGMGLLMIKSCTADLVYRQTQEDLHRLEFLVSADIDPWLNIPF